MSYKHLIDLERLFKIAFSISWPEKLRKMIVSNFVNAHLVIESKAKAEKVW